MELFHIVFHSDSFTFNLPRVTLASNMVNSSISHDVKIAAINLYEQNILSVKQILASMGFSRRTFFRVLNL